MAAGSRGDSALYRFEQKKLTADRLASAIQAAVTDSEMKERTRSCDEAIRAENGINNAVALIKQYLGEPGDGKGKQTG